MTEPETAPAPPAAGGEDAAIGALLGRAIREARLGKKLSMRSLAARAEISQPFLSAIESGRTMPSMITLYRLAKALGISASALLPSEPDPAAIRVSRVTEGSWVPVAEVPSAALVRVLSAGVGSVTRVSEIRVEEGQYLGDWYESDGELTVYLVEGRMSVELEGHGSWDLAPGEALSHPGAIRNRWTVLGEGPVRVLLVYAAGR